MKALKLMVLLLAMQGPLVFGQPVAPARTFDKQDLFQNILDKQSLVATAMALKGTDTSTEAQDVGYFCADRLKDFDNTSMSLEHQKDCLARLITLYKAKAGSFADNSNFDENLRQLELLAQGADKGLFKKTGLTLTPDKEANAIEISSMMGDYGLDLRRLFKLEGGKSAEDFAGKFSYSVVGCEASLSEVVAGKDDNEAVEVSDLRPLATRIKQLNHFNGLIDCYLDSAKDLLVLSAQTRAKGSTTLIVNAVYTDSSGKNTLAKATNNVLVRVAPLSKPNYCTGWSCQYNTGFFIGAEGASVEEVSSEAILRYEFAAYSQVQHNHVHFFGRIFQTTKSELKPTETSPVPDCAAATAECEAEVNASISGEIGMNLFVAKSKGDKDKSLDWFGFESPLESDDLAFGPSIQYSIIKSDEGDKEFTNSYYAGLRFAQSKYQYFDILYGKDEGVEGNRVKLKGQLPAYNDNFIVGVEINVSADSEQKKAGREGVDNIKLYVTYEVDFRDFLK